MLKERKLSPFKWVFLKILLVTKFYFELHFGKRNRIWNLLIKALKKFKFLISRFHLFQTAIHIAEEPCNDG